MPSLISASRQSAVTKVLKDLHDTFSKEIIAYKNAIAVCNVPSSSYNSIYDNAGPSTSVTYTEVKQSFMARIYFVKSDQEFFYNGRGLNGSNDKLILPQGFVKIIVEQDAFDFIKESRKVEFDGVMYSVRSAGNHANPEGLFDYNLYEFHLTPLNE